MPNVDACSADSLTSTARNNVSIEMKTQGLLQPEKCRHRQGNFTLI